MKVGELFLEMGLKFDASVWDVMDSRLQALASRMDDLGAAWRAAIAKDAEAAKHLLKSWEAQRKGTERAIDLIGLSAPTSLKASSATEKLAGSVRKLAGRFAGPLAAALAVHQVGAYADQMDRLKDSAASVGASTDLLQTWGWVATQNGSDAETASDGLQKLIVGLKSATTAASPMADALKAVGISSTDAAVKAGDIESLLPRIMDGFATIQNPAKRASVSVALFSKAGIRLTEALAAGSKSMVDAKREMQDLGAFYDTAEIEKAADYNDTQAKLSATWKGMRATLLRDLLPALVSTGKVFLSFYTSTGRNILKGFVSVVKVIIHAAKGVALTAAELIKLVYKIVRTFTPMIKIAEMFFQRLREGSKLAYAALVPLGIVAYATLAKVAAGFSIALGPALAMVAAVAAAVVVFEDLGNWFSGEGNSVIEDWVMDARGWLRDKFADMVDSVAGGFRNAFNAVFEWFAAKLRWVGDKIDSMRRRIAGALGMGLKPGEGYEDSAEKQAEAERRFAERSKANGEALARYRAQQAQAPTVPVPAGGNTQNATSNVVINVTSNSADPAAVADQIKRAQAADQAALARKLKR